MASPVEPRDEAEKVKILEAALQEMRLKYQGLNTDYSDLGTKIFTLLGTELVITTFLFSVKLNANKPLFALSNLVITIFFVVGISSICIALGLLFWATTSNDWANPAELKELELLRYITYADFLQDVKDDYIKAYRFCKGRYGQRRIAFDGSVLTFVTGAIILMVIKIGGIV